MVKKMLDVLFWLGVALYFGGLVALGPVAAGGIFKVSRDAQLSMPGIASPPLDMSRQVGGELFGEVLRRFGVIEGIALALMLAGIAGWVLGHKTVRRSSWIAAVFWVIVASLALIDIAWLRPKVWAERLVVRAQAATMTAAATQAAWPARDEFDKLHQWAEFLGRTKGEVLFAMILVVGWRGVAEAWPTSGPASATRKTEKETPCPLKTPTRRSSAPARSSPN
jgi:hypothetical protein